MKILSVGGGSGGHVTPVVAVLREIKQLHPRAEVRFWCDHHFAPQAQSIIDEYNSSIPVQKVWSGKLRRYQHLSAVEHLMIPSVIFPNIRDAILVLLGTLQSIVRLILWRPNVVFAKGGYVCLPVGWAAWLLRIPLVIHDSDAVPGLTNRLLAPVAKRIATGVSLEHYDYPASKSIYVGIPIDPQYRVMSDKKRLATKVNLGFDSKRPLVVFVGGGQGAKQINAAVALHLPELLHDTNVLLISGSAQYDEMRSLTPQNDSRYILKSFVSHGMADIMGAADIVVTRAGATALLELAALARPTIVIPSKRLKWQVKHAQLFIDEHSVYPLDEDKFEEPGDTSLVTAIRKVLDDSALRQRLANNLHRMARPHAARDMAETIVHAARKRR